MWTYVFTCLFIKRYIWLNVWHASYSAIVLLYNAHILCCTHTHAHTYTHPTLLSNSWCNLLVLSHHLFLLVISVEKKFWKNMRNGTHIRNDDITAPAKSHIGKFLTLWICFDSMERDNLYFSPHAAQASCNQTFTTPSPLSSTTYVQPPGNFKIK